MKEGVKRKRKKKRNTMTEGSREENRRETIEKEMKDGRWGVKKRMKKGRERKRKQKTERGRRHRTRQRAK